MGLCQSILRSFRRREVEVFTLGIIHQICLSIICFKANFCYLHKQEQVEFEGIINAVNSYSSESEMLKGLFYYLSRRVRRIAWLCVRTQSRRE